MLVLIIILIFILGAYCLNCRYNNNNKKLVIESYFDQGLFGQILNFNEYLHYLYSNKLYPEFRFKSKHYGDKNNNDLVLPYILKQKKISKYDINEIPRQFKGNTTEDRNNIYINRQFLMDYKDRNTYPQKDNFDYINKLFNIYFKINPKLENSSLNIIQPFKSQKILGIHYRGTDKIKSSENKAQITNQLFIQVLQDLIKKHNFNTIFLATDDNKIESIIYSNLKIKIIKQQNVKKLNNQPIHFSKQITNQDKTEQAFIDCLTLSKCNYVLITNSALGAWTKILNPKLKVYKLQKDTQKWFPASKIPFYRSDNININQKLIELQS